MTVTFGLRGRTGRMPQAAGARAGRAGGEGSRLGGEGSRLAGRDRGWRGGIEAGGEGSRLAGRDRGWRGGIEGRRGQSRAGREGADGGRAGRGRGNGESRGKAARPASRRRPVAGVPPGRGGTAGLLRRQRSRAGTGSAVRGLGRRRPAKQFVNESPATACSCAVRVTAGKRGRNARMGDMERTDGHEAVGWGRAGRRSPAPPASPFASASGGGE
jgi:hypothetical protein